jgi:phenylacetate-CoA ligase
LNPILARWLYYGGQAWRGEPVTRVLRELEESQHWPASRLHELQWERMCALARHAYDTVPFYRRHWDAAGLSPDSMRGRDDWDRLPTLSKAEIQESAQEMRSTQAPRGHVATTSGSSGTPIAVWRSHASWAHAHANVFRGWHWHGIEVGDRYAYFWGLALDRAGQRQARVRDAFFNRLRLSAFDTSDESASAFYERLVRWRPAFGFGYPSAAAQFADAVTRLGLDGTRIGFRAIITTAEVLHPHRRERLETTFGCRVVDTYGCAEAGITGFACEAGGMHVPVESVVVDLVPAGDGLFEVLITDLFNYSQPVIRYRIGDLVERGAPDCPCGRQLPLLGRIHGRAGDSLQLADGRVVNGLLPYYIFRHHAKSGKVFEYQFAQYPDGALELRVSPGPGWEDSLVQEIETEVSEGLGIRVRLRVVPRFERVGRGKHRDFVKVDAEGNLLAARGGPEGRGAGA